MDVLHLLWQLINHLASFLGPLAIVYAFVAGLVRVLKRLNVAILRMRNLYQQKSIKLPLVFAKSKIEKRGGVNSHSIKRLILSCIPSYGLIAIPSVTSEFFVWNISWVLKFLMLLAASYVFSKTLFREWRPGAIGVVQNVYVMMTFLLGLAGIFLSPFVLLEILSINFGMVSNDLTISLILLPGLLASLPAMVWFGEEWDYEVL